MLKRIPKSSIMKGGKVMFDENNDGSSITTRTGERKYQDKLFTDYLSRDNRALHVYSALTGKEYDDSTEMTIYKLGSVLFNDLYNDLSFVIDGKLVVFFEDQVTPNPNMPVRMLEYLSRYYEDFTKREENGNIFGTTLIHLPKPEFIVFYNGEDKQDKESVYRLSDAFDKTITTLTEIELVVKVYNINYDVNQELLSESKELHDYAAFVYKVKDYLHQQHDLGDAISYAIRDSIKEGIMVEYLKERREEVYSMLRTQYVIEQELKAARADGRNEERLARDEKIKAAKIDGEKIGEKKGKEEGKAEIAKNLKNLGIASEAISKATGLSPDVIELL
jgi:predicted transposase/invertase (TIGR01784 family)